MRVNGVDLTGDLNSMRDRTLDVGRVGAALARAKRADGPGDVDLRLIRSMDAAREVQDAALAGHGGTVTGYTLAASSAVTSRRLNCFDPVVGRMLDDSVYGSGDSLRLPYGTLGIGAQFILVIGAPVREPLDLRSVADAVLSCRVGLQLLGRRVGPGVPLNDWSATADFALDVACVRGPEIPGWDEVDLARIDLSLEIDGHVVARGRGAYVLVGPTAALLYLALSLRDRDIRLQAGDVVATGSATGLSQVVPGQRVVGVFGGFGTVDLALV